MSQKLVLEDRNIIRGLCVRVTKTELLAHCQERAAHHRGRADHKEKELPDLKRILEATKASTSVNPISNSYHSNPDSTIKSLQDDIEDHRNKAVAFDFYANHLFDQDYEFSLGDLQQLEFVKRY